MAGGEKEEPSKKPYHGGDTRKPTAVVGPAQVQKPDCGGSWLFSDYKLPSVSGKLGAVFLGNCT